MRSWIVYAVLLTVKAISRLFYRHVAYWVDEPEDLGQDYAVVAVFNHTSLFEFLLAGSVPNRFLWRMASKGVVPIAAKTLDRPVIGQFWGWIAGQVVAISRERDHTWAAVIDKIEADSMIVLFPEGRMKRKGGLDKNGNPMTVRGGIADIVMAMPRGRILLSYSQGLHHIQVPGQLIPRLFRPVRLIFESVDVEAYRDSFGDLGEVEFKKAVVADLTVRRDRWCQSDVGEEPEIPKADQV